MTINTLYLAEGYRSLHAYCTRALRLSEDAACNRIEAARACRRFPMILDLLASGEMTLTSVRRLGRYLTPQNHQSVLEKAKRATRERIDLFVATLAPRPDAPTVVRKLPTATPATSLPAAQVAMSIPSEPVATSGALPAPAEARPRPTVQLTAPERYRVQFTIGQATREKLRKLQTLLRREIPDGDPGVLFDRALTLLLEHVENKKLGLAAKPRSDRSIRRGTDKADEIDVGIRTPPRLSRNVPRASSARSGDVTGASAPSSRRMGGGARSGRSWSSITSRPTRRTVRPRSRTSLSGWRHNRYEAELVFGPRGAGRQDASRLEVASRGITTGGASPSGAR